MGPGHFAIALAAKPIAPKAPLWVLDFIVHLPYPSLFFAGSPKVGLALWETGPGLVLSGIIEVLLLAGGIAVYIIWRRKK